MVGETGELELENYGKMAYEATTTERKDKYVDMKYYGKNFFFLYKFALFCHVFFFVLY